MLAVLLSFSSVLGHGAMVSPTSRNAIERTLPDYQDGRSQSTRKSFFFPPIFPIYPSLCLSRTNFHLLILITATPMRTQHARAQTDMKINTRRKGCCSMPPSHNKEMGQKMLALQIKVYAVTFIPSSYSHHFLSRSLPAYMRVHVIKAAFLGVYAT